MERCKTILVQVGGGGGLLPEGCQDKVPWENASFFSFFSQTQLQSTLLKNIDRTAQKAMSSGFVCQSRRVQRSLRKDCHVASPLPLLALW